MTTSPLPTELAVLAWSVVLLLVHVVIQGSLATLTTGVDYNASARDQERSPGLYGGRAKRALANLLETYPAFVALALALVVSNRAGGYGATGALIWIAARVVYVPLYLFGVPVVRSIVWLVSLAGLVMMLVRLLA
jgi:uncharacterized MAPEG superfamily protein